MATAVTSRDTVAGIGAMALLAAEKPFFQSAAQLVAERHFELQERMEKMRQFAAPRCQLDIVRERIEKMQAAEAERWQRYQGMTGGAALEYIKEQERKARSLSECVKEHEARLERLIRPNPAILALMRGNPPSEPKMPVSEPLRTPPPQAQSPLPAPQPVPQPENGISARHQPPAPVVSEPQSEPQFVIDGKAVSETEYQDWVVSNHYRTIGQKGNYARGAVKRQIIADFIRENREFGTSKNQFAAKQHKRYSRTYATIRNILKKVTV